MRAAEVAQVSRGQPPSKALIDHNGVVAALAEDLDLAATVVELHGAHWMREILRMASLIERVSICSQALASVSSCP
jgi:hypothetical protein